MGCVISPQTIEKDEDRLKTSAKSLFDLKFKLNTG